MAEPLEFYVEEIQTMQSTLFNYYLCKVVQNYLDNQGKRLQVTRQSLVWDWSNGYGLQPIDLFQDLLEKQFDATVTYISSRADNYAQLFAKFPLGTVKEIETEFIKVDFPSHFEFSTKYKLIEEVDDPWGYLGIYSEETKFHMVAFDHTIVFSHCLDSMELNYTSMLKQLFLKIDGENE